MLHNKTNIQLCLIRHAESIMNTQPELIAGRSPHSELSAKGIEQSHKLGRYLKLHNIHFQKVYSSPLIRSKTTAELVLKEMSEERVGIIEAPELVEFTQGDWEGRSRKEIYTPEIVKYMNAKGAFFKPPNGESQIMVENRVSGWFMKEILHNNKYLQNKITIAIFSHGLTIKCFLHFVMGFNDRLIHRIKLDNTSICILRFTHEGWFVDAINHTRHLDL